MFSMQKKFFYTRFQFKASVSSGIFNVDLYKNKYLEVLSLCSLRNLLNLTKKGYLGNLFLVDMKK